MKIGFGMNIKIVGQNKNVMFYNCLEHLTFHDFKAYLMTNNFCESYRLKDV